MDEVALQELKEWLVDGARSAPSPPQMMTETCERLVAAGLPLWRVGVFVRTLHPDIIGRNFIWRPGAEVVVGTAHYDVLDSPEFLSSPLAVVFSEHREVRARLDGPDGKRFPLFDELREEEVTEYIALPLFQVDGTAHASTWTTKQPGGFTDEQVRAIRGLLPPLSRLIEVTRLRFMSSILLDTYVGNRAGERILGGQIRRGHAETMQAAIWLSDLRGFTALSDRLPAETVVEILNLYFDCQVSAIATHGGEVLKFMGDGLLAVFPFDEYVGDPGHACAKVLEAACEARANVEALQFLVGETIERFRFGVGAACRADPLRQYWRWQPSRFHLHRTCGQSCSTAGKDDGQTASHDRGIESFRRDMSWRLGGSRRISDRRIFKGRARLWLDG